MLWAATLLDIETLNTDIKTVVLKGQSHKSYLDAVNSHKNGYWTTDANGYLCLKGQIFVPNIGNLILHVMKAKHDYILMGHPRQAKTLQLVQQDYIWLNL